MKIKNLIYITSFLLCFFQNTLAQQDTIKTKKEPEKEPEPPQPDPNAEINPEEQKEEEVIIIDEIQNFYDRNYSNLHCEILNLSAEYKEYNIILNHVINILYIFQVILIMSI